MNIDLLQTKGFVPVEYPPELRSCVAQTMRSWKDFCALPKEHKLLLSKGDRQDDFGYMLRDGSADDPKEQFHLLRATLTEVREMARKAGEIENNPTALEFIESGDILIQAMTPLIREFARNVEQRFGVTGFQSEVMAMQDFWTFRFIHYFGSEVLAQPHADRGGFTLHAYESANGGEYLDLQDKTWHSWPIDNKETIIFPGMGLQYRSNNQLKGLCHQVKSTIVTRQLGRYAMVAFIDFMGRSGVKPVKRLQDMSPGFNYNMSLDELREFMVPVEVA